MPIIGFQKSLEKVESQVKDSEKSANFEMDIEWYPCFVPWFVMQYFVSFLVFQSS